MSPLDVSVVIPAYRSAVTLDELVERLVRVLDARGGSYEIILVEDGSPDDTWKTARSLHERYPQRVVAVQLMRNFGQHNALMCGFRHARGEIIVTMDDDLQQLPEDVPALIDTLQQGDYDLVYGRFGDRRHAAWRNLGSVLIHHFWRLAFQSEFRASPFRAIRAAVVRSILTYTLNYTFVDGLLAWNTRRIGDVPVAHRPRAQGGSGYSVRKLLVLSFNLFTNFSLLPLQMISAAGVLAAGLGFAASLYYLVEYLLAHTTVPGYTSVILAVLILGGTQLVGLGMLGEYVGRLHMNVNRKPQYVERQVLGAADDRPQRQAA